MINYSIFGDDGIDQGSRTQIENACDLVIARKAALMPDAHQGYGLPIGGVLATENAVIPYGVGVDIACRMRITFTDASTLAMEALQRNNPVECGPIFDEPLKKETRFGMGCEFKRSGRRNHDVMDDPRWGCTEFIHGLKDTAWKQLGTSGGGNHFVEWGVAHLYQKVNGTPPGKYVTLMSHSGSRGAGSKVCNYYHKVAKKQNHSGELSWLDLDSEAGQEYWEAMSLMGEYAAANHLCIHNHVLKSAGLQKVGHVENHHNFAWKETHDDEELIVHRKGATPAVYGELGVIPGSMATPAYIVRGRGNALSIDSASHGAGRAMSRTAAKKAFTWEEWEPRITASNVRLLGGGIDEVPGSYKDINKVMDDQRELVEIVGEFHPRIVLMAN